MLNRAAIRLLGFLAIIAVSGWSYACKAGDKQSGAKNGPGAAHDTLEPER